MNDTFFLEPLDSFPQKSENRQRGENPTMFTVLFEICVNPKTEKRSSSNSLLYFIFSMFNYPFEHCREFSQNCALFLES